MERKILFAALAAAMFLTSGCIWSRVKVNDDGVLDRSSAIVENKTRESELERILKAKPTMRMPGKNSTLLGYTYSDTKMNGLMLVLVNFTRSTTVADTLYIETDSENGIVKKVHRPVKTDINWKFWPFN